MNIISSPLIFIETIALKLSLDMGFSCGSPVPLFRIGDLPLMFIIFSFLYCKFSFERIWIESVGLGWIQKKKKETLKLETLENLGYNIHILNHC